jgi:hypothetical protein
MRVIQYVDTAGTKAVGIAEGAVVAKVATYRSTYDAVLAAIAKGVKLSALLDADRDGTTEDYDAIRLYQPKTAMAQRIWMPPRSERRS